MKPQEQTERAAQNRSSYFISLLLSDGGYSYSHTLFCGFFFPSIFVDFPFIGCTHGPLGN